MFVINCDFYLIVIKYPATTHVPALMLKIKYCSERKKL